MLQGTLPPRSNLANWGDTIEIYDDDTNEPINLADAADVIVTFRDGCAWALSARLSDGTVVLEDDGLSCSFNFTKTQMGALEPKTYEFGIRVIFTEEIDELQLFLGFIPIVKGL